MASTFSNSLRIELIGSGEQAGTWGTTTNRNLGTLIESAIAGYTAVTTVAAKQALTVADGATDQARSAMLALNTSTGAAFEVFAPPVSKLYAVRNVSSHTATLYNSTSTGNTTAAGLGVAIPAGRQLLLMTDGTDFRVLGNISDTANTPNTVVERDGNGDFAAGTITADLVGDVTGNVTGNVSGSAGSLATVNPILKGGTGADNAAQARINLGTNRVPPVSTTGAYTLLASDVGQSVFVDANVTVPPDVFSAGDVVVVYNNSTNPISVARGAGVTMFWTGGVNNNRALDARGLATLLCVASNVFVVTGQGLS